MLRGFKWLLDLLKQSASLHHCNGSQGVRYICWDADCYWLSGTLPKGETLTLGGQEMLRKMPDQLHRIPIFCLMLKKKGGEWQRIKLSHAEPNLTVLKRLLKPQEFGGGWNRPNKSLQTSYSMILAFFDLVYELLMMAPGFLQTFME